MDQTQSIINRWKAGIAQSKRIKSWFRSISRSGVKLVQDADSIHKEVFNKIDCLDCANCCKSIPPIVSRRDVKRISRHLGLSFSEFEAKYTITDNDGDKVINQSPCPFLLEDNRCRIYEIRPAACRAYPHTGDMEFYKHLSLHKQNIRYCPALFEIVRRIYQNIENLK